MTKSDPDAVWVLQTWIFLNQQTLWTQPRIQAFLGAVSNEQMLCLDLACEDRPQWSRTQAFCGKPWLWCNVQNYGNTVFLGGALDKNNTGLMAARQHPDRGDLVGLGFVNEGLGYNPVTHDLMFEMAWRNEPVVLDQWIKRYAGYRYGQSNGDARTYGFTVETSLDGQAWDLVADRRDNRELSTAHGYTCLFEPREARYIRITQTHNSANTGLALSGFNFQVSGFSFKADSL